MLVCLDLVGCIDLLNFVPNPLIELLDLLDPLGSIHISPLIHRPWGKVKRGEGLNSINHLEGHKPMVLLGAQLYANSA